LEAIVERISQPNIFEEEQANNELKALVFDSQYDNYR
jgi:translation elongation factor EF-4